MIQVDGGIRDTDAAFRLFQAMNRTGNLLPEQLSLLAFQGLDGSELSLGQVHSLVFLAQSQLIEDGVFIPQLPTFPSNSRPRPTDRVVRKSPLERLQRLSLLVYQIDDASLEAATPATRRSPVRVRLTAQGQRAADALARPVPEAHQHWLKQIASWARRNGARIHATASKKFRTRASCSAAA